MKTNYAFTLAIEITSEKPFAEIPKAELITAVRDRLIEIEMGNETEPFTCFDSMPEDNSPNKIIGENPVETTVLETQRSAAAEIAFQSHDFGSLIVTDQDGWTRDGVFWSKRVYGTDEETDASSAVSFGVQFAENSDKVLDTWIR